MASYPSSALNLKNSVPKKTIKQIFEELDEEKKMDFVRFFSQDFLPPPSDRHVLAGSQCFS